MDEPLFRETQRLTARWVVFPVAGMAAGALAPLAFAIVDRRPLLADPGFLAGLILPVVLGAGVLFLVVTCRLTTEIRAEGITYRFFPFHLSERRIGWAEIASCAIRTYRPIVEYGGWGLRCGLGGRGRAYNVKGNVGLQVRACRREEDSFRHPDARRDGEGARGRRRTPPFAGLKSDLQGWVGGALAPRTRNPSVAGG
jgi:hypothetical protein